MALQIRYPGGIFGPRRQRSLIKKLDTKTYSAFIELPQFRAKLPTQMLQKHVPSFFHHLRESGNRRIDPLDCFRPFFTNVGDEQIFGIAMQWIFANIGLYSNGQLGFQIPTLPPYLDPFDTLINDIVHWINQGDQVQAEEALDDMISIFQVVGKLLRDDRYGYSPQLFNEYFNTALGLVPYVQNFWYLGSDPIYEFVRGVWEASGGDRNMVLRIVNQFGLNERTALIQYAFNIARTGDIYAAELYNTI